MDDAKVALYKRYARVTGNDPVYLGDILNVLTHPDVIEFTRAWLDEAESKPATAGIVLTDIEQTCFACPSQWDAYDAAGKYYYIRYRWGFLSVHRDGEQIYGDDVGEDDYDGVMSTEKMLELTGMTLNR